MTIIDGVKVTERGWAGHFIGADSCKFRRNTLLEYKNKKWIVSTVGQMAAANPAFADNLHGYMMIGHERYYETMAFKAHKEYPPNCENKKSDYYWEADVSKMIDFDNPWSLNECEFMSDKKANLMHDKVVEELIKKIKEEKKNDNNRD